MDGVRELLIRRRLFEEVFVFYYGLTSICDPVVDTLFIS